MKQFSLRRLSASSMLIASLVVLFGTGSARAGVGDYFADRWYDFADIFTARVSAAQDGKSAGVMVRATALAQMGLVYFNGEHAGLDRRALGIWREKRLHGALGPIAWNEIEMRTIKGTDYAHDDTEWTDAQERGIVRNGLYYDDGRQEPLAIGVELQPGILPGFEFRVHPLQALDFIVGWTTMDVYNDDEPAPEDDVIILYDSNPEELPEYSDEDFAPSEKISDVEIEVELEETELPAAPQPDTTSPPAAQLGDIPIKP